MTDPHSPLPSSSVVGVTGAPDATSVRDLAGLHRDVWALFRAHPIPLVVVPLLCWLPFDLLSEYISRAAVDDPWGQFRVYMRIQRFVGAFLGTVLLAGVSGALIRLARGFDLTTGTVLSEGTAVFGRVFGALWLGGLATVVGILFFVLPGLYLAACFALVIPVVLLENKGGMEALKRSMALVKERGVLTVLGYGFGMYLVYVALSLAPSFVTTFGLAMLGVEAPAWVDVVLGLPANLVGLGVAAGAVLLYYDITGDDGAYPVGRKLLAHDGTRIPGPRGSGTPGLVLATVIGGISFLLLVGATVLGVMGNGY